MVKAKCRRPECLFTIDDAEHMEDCLAKMRAHFRLEHPTKVFWEREFLETAEQYNYDLDEAVAMYLGGGWRQGEWNDAQIVHACSRIAQYPDTYNPDLIEAARELSRQHGREIPAPAPPQPMQNVVLDPGVMAPANAQVLRAQILPEDELAEDLEAEF